MPNPYHVRLAVSQYGEQFRAELFTEDLGDTNGDMLPAQWKRLDDEFLSYLAMGAAGLPADTARGAGRELFDFLLGGGENGNKWVEVLKQAERQKRPVRLLIDATTDRVRDLPYGLLCDSHDDYYLVRPGSGRPPIQFVRILRRCTPRILDLKKPRLSVLLVAAEPDKLPKFACAQRLCELAKGLAPHCDVLFCVADRVKHVRDAIPGDPDRWQPDHFEPFCGTTRASLQCALKSGEYDILHLLAHGFGNGVVLCDAEGGRAEVTSSELGQWCGEGNLQMAFLQVCKASLTDGRGGFGGVAQQLLNPKYGNLAAVVASPYPVDAERSLPAALSFYKALAEGHPPDAALDRGLEEGNLSWAFLELWVRPSALKDTGSRGAFQFASPYRGLATFEERDAEIFFGREAETAELFNVLSTEPVVAVVGDTGSGKSSVLQAGLIHHVRQQGLAGEQGWRIVLLTPGDRPGQRLLARLTRGDQGTTVDMPWAHDANTALRDVLKQLCSGDKRLLIVFDQFEETFTLCDDEVERRELAQALADTAQSYPRSFRLILGMRSEFLGQAAALPGLIQLIKRPWVLKPPGSDEVRAIVFEPADHHGYTFEGPRQDGDPRHAKSLLDRILEDPLLTWASSAEPDVATGPEKPSAPLPLLEFALERLWLKAVGRGAHEFLHEDYDAMGGLAGAIAQHAEEAFVSLGSRPELLEDERDGEQVVAAKGAARSDVFLIAERIWTGLISSRGTRRPRTRGDLETETGHPEVARRVIDRLVGERLLTIRSNAEDLAEVRVDISHEILVHRWERLRHWLETSTEVRALREEFQRDAERWNEGMPGTGRRSGKNLPSFQTINLYLTFIDRVKPSLTEVQNAFEHAMRNQLRRQKQIVQIVMATSVIVAVVMAGLAVWAFRAQIESDKERDQANTAMVEAKQARDEAEKAKEEVEQALALNQIQRGVAACKGGKPADGMCWLLRAYEMSHPEDPYRKSACNLMAGWNAFLGYALVHESPVIETAFTANGQTLVSVSMNGKVRIWEKGDTPTWETDFRECQRQFDHGGKLHAAAISPDAQTVITCGEDGNVYAWDVSGMEQRRTLQQHGLVSDLAFSQDGRRLVSATNAKDSKSLSKNPSRPTPLPASGASGEGVRMGSKYLAQVWDVEQLAAVGPPLSHDAEVLAVAISPDGTWACTGAADGTAHISELGAAGDCPPQKIECGDKAVVAVAISPDGKWMAAGTEDGGAWLWTVDDPQRGLELRDDVRRKAHQDRVDVVAFSPNSATLVTGSMDNTARLWDVATQTSLGYPIDHDGPVLVAFFLDDGERLLTGSGDGTTRISDASTGERKVGPIQDDHGVIAAAISPDGNTIAVGNLGRSLRLWDLRKRQPYREIVKLDPAISALAVNPDVTLGPLVAIATEDGKTQIRDITTGNLLTQQPPDHEGPVSAVAFSPDGKWLATASRDDSARLWNLIRSDWPGHRLDHDDQVTSVSFAPDGRTVLTGCLDGRVRFWDTQTGQMEGEPFELSDQVLAAAFSPDGAHFATGGANDAAYVWKLATRQRRCGPLDHDGDVVALAFSPDGKRILTGSLDGTARLWDAQTGERLWRGESVTHSGPRIVSVAFGPHGRNIATGSWEGTAQLWDAETGMPHGVPMWHEPRVYAVALSPTGDRLLTGSNHGSVRLWPVEPPLTDDPAQPAQIRTYVEVRTGRYWTNEQYLVPIAYDQWIARQKELQKTSTPRSGRWKTDR